METVLSFWYVFSEMAPWLAAGFLFAGIIAVWIPGSWVKRVMGGALGWNGVFRAVMIGVPLPVCSCGVLPLATGLRKHGAGKGPTAAFLISTPQTGIDSILATYALLGPVFAIARPLAAVLTGLTGGGIVAAVGGKDTSVVQTEEPLAMRRDLKAILFQAYRRLLGSVVKPLTVGLAVSALVTVFVPDNFFADVFKGNDFLAMPAMAVIGFPMYVCSTASIPIAASLVAKGISPGAAFVFLMVGPAMNAMSVTTVSSLIGRKATVAYVTAIMVGAILCGSIINLIPDLYIPSSLSTTCGKCPPSMLHQTCAVFLAVMMVYNLFRPVKMKKRKE